MRSTPSSPALTGPNRPLSRVVASRSEAAAHGKRVQAQGGAKNPVIVLPDADMDMATKIIADSAFGCAGQRCLAVSFAVTVGSARNTFTELICDAATSRVVGYGLDYAERYRNLPFVGVLHPHVYKQAGKAPAKKRKA